LLFWRAWCLLRKEVIQPQFLLQLPYYDFAPIAGHTVGLEWVPVQRPRRIDGRAVAGEEPDIAVGGAFYPVYPVGDGNLALIEVFPIPLISPVRWPRATAGEALVQRDMSPGIPVPNRASSNPDEPDIISQNGWHQVVVTPRRLVQLAAGRDQWRRLQGRSPRRRIKEGPRRGPPLGALNRNPV